VKAIQLNRHGDPADAVTVVDIPDVGPPAPDEVVIDVEASPIQPTDLLMIAGTYGYQPPAPHILGVEGVGRVSAVGRDVKHLSEGDRTLIPPFTPAWAQRVKTSAPWLRPLPDGDLNQLSMLGMNPLTAYVMLTEFGELQPGDWLLQNGANSSVGRAVIPMAKAMGIRTVNVVRRAELVDELLALGGDVVLIDGPDLPQRVAAVTDNAKIMLAFDCVGDTTTEDLLKSMPLYGNVVVYSGMSGKPFTVSGPRLLFYGQSLHGYWVFNWLQDAANLDKLTDIYAYLAPLVVCGAISSPVDNTFTFDQFADAVAVAARFSGKAILTPNSG
jgi:NADPH:quinone reductase-like Zn-dependent oxidoreductase